MHTIVMIADKATMTASTISIILKGIEPAEKEKKRNQIRSKVCCLRNTIE